MLPELWYFIILFWGLLIFGRLKKDIALVGIGGFLLMILGVYGFISFNTSNLLYFSFSITHFFLGFYFIVRSSIEINKEDWNIPRWGGLKQWLKRKKNKNQNQNQKKNL